jgi:hypothetical protein
MKFNYRQHICSKRQAKITSIRKASIKMLECCICYEMNVSSIDLTDCGHAICGDCMVRMEKSICPICRESIELSEEAKQVLERKNIQKQKIIKYANLFKTMVRYYNLNLYWNNISDDY